MLGVAWRRLVVDVSLIALLQTLDRLSSYIPSSSTLAPQAIYSTPISSHGTLSDVSLISFQGQRIRVIDRKTPSSLYSRGPMDRQWGSDLDGPCNPAKNPWLPCVDTTISAVRSSVMAQDVP
ncbi:hypothetical protein EV421DRAFT_560277 [Armillaria borealis]|uniref:Uncharacterized protein n=1 Tax=Armillaria borealis TaxID=47425 RepID=A0AA39JJD4_9AGAR|nr:hypothetical protein EV421DRAFT_560277 [Armillaria borealis]